MGHKLCWLLYFGHNLRLRALQRHPLNVEQSKCGDLMTSSAIVGYAMTYYKWEGDTPSIGCHLALYLCGSCKLICHDLEIEMDL